MDHKSTVVIGVAVLLAAASLPARAGSGTDPVKTEQRQAALIEALAGNSKVLECASDNEDDCVLEDGGGCYFPTDEPSNHHGPRRYHVYFVPHLFGHGYKLVCRTGYWYGYGGRIRGGETSATLLDSRHLGPDFLMQDVGGQPALIYKPFVPEGAKTKKELKDAIVDLDADLIARNGAVGRIQDLARSKALKKDIEDVRRKVFGPKGAAASFPRP